EDENVWITIGADAFESASRLFPRGADGESLRRVAEADAVVLTQVPRSGLDALSAEIHHVHLRCGGYVLHASREEGEAELARVVAANQQTLGGLPFAIDQPDWVATVAGGIEESEILSTI